MCQLFKPWNAICQQDHLMFCFKYICHSEFAMAGFQTRTFIRSSNEEQQKKRRESWKCDDLCDACSVLSLYIAKWPRHTFKTCELVSDVWDKLQVQVLSKNFSDRWGCEWWEQVDAQVTCVTQIGHYPPLPIICHAFAQNWITTGKFHNFLLPVLYLS